MSDSSRGTTGSAATFKITVNVEPETTNATPVNGTVLKADDAQRFLLTVAYAADRVDPFVGLDGHRDFATKPVVEQCAWNYMRKGAKAGMWHRPGNEDAAEVVESYVWRGEPWVIKAEDGSEQTIMPGDWLVGMVLSEQAWGLYKAGKIGGVSIQGTAKRRTPDPETLALLRS